MGNWGYNNYKWCYGPLLISGDGAHFEGMLFACLVIEDAGIVTLNKKPKNIPSSSSGNPKWNSYQKNDSQFSIDFQKHTK